MLNTRVTTNDGVVTVSSGARNPVEKALVTRLVTDINGVRSVVNNMTLDEAAPRNNYLLTHRSLVKRSVP
jgi:hypothetical protein